MTTWTPISLDELEALIQVELNECSDELRGVFTKFRVPAYLAPLERYGKLGEVFVVARRGDEVLYYEDVEEGFNFSPVDLNGRVLEHWCNQDELRFALVHWLSAPEEDARARLGPGVKL